MGPNDYVSVAEIAKKFGVGKTTVQRRVTEGRLFPGAKLGDIGTSKGWQIPRTEADAVSLEDLSWKAYHSRVLRELRGSNSESRLAPQEAGSLEERVAKLERLLLRCLDRLS